MVVVSVGVILISVFFINSKSIAKGREQHTISDCSKKSRYQSVVITTKDAKLERVAVEYC